MLRRSLLMLPLLMMLHWTLPAQETLTNESILKLVKAGIGDDMIVNMIKTQNARFSVSTDDVIALKGGGVSEKIIGAMVSKGNVASPAPAGDAALLSKEGIALPDELGVYRLKDGKYVAVAPEVLNLRTARAAQMLVGIAAKAKINGWVTSQHSQTHVPPEVDFVVKLPEGTDPAEYVCLKFEIKKDRREVELARGRINFATGTQRSAVPFTSEKLAKQIYRLKFTAFKDGEFGLLPPGANVSATAMSAGKIYTFMVE